MHKIIISLLALVMLLSVVSGRASAQELPFEEQFRRAMAQAREEAAAAAAEYQRTDQITTVLVGTASPISTAGAQTSTAIFVNGQFLLFDMGNNAMQSLYDLNIPTEEVDAVFITHYHYDHMAELADIIQWSWINGRQHTLPVYGPPGLTQVLHGFEDAYALDSSYRWLHHSEELMPPEFSGAEGFEFEEPEGDEAIVVYENDGVTVEAFHVNHDPADPAVGFRVLYEDKLIVISGDTIITPGLIANSQDADLLVAATMNFAAVEVMEEVAREAGDERQATLFFDIRDYLMDVSDVGEVAQEANVKRLALNHIAPNVANEIQLNQWFVNPIQDVYEGEIFAGGDGLTIVIPVPQEADEPGCSEQIASNDKAGRWLCGAISAIDADVDLGDEAKTLVNSQLLQLATEPTERCNGSMDTLLETMRADFPTFTDQSTLEVQRTLERVCSPLTYHDAYWVTEIESQGRTIVNINDMHVDAATNEVRVYAQGRVLGQIIAPPQAGPGECAETPNGETACYHPNAVYLNGSGQELLESDGTGGWWVKHAWTLDGDGYGNCELFATEYDNCIWAEGEVWEDGLSMKIGGTGEIERNFFNVRTPLLEEEPISYRVRRFQPTNIDPNAADIDLTPVNSGFDLIWECQEEVSPFDGLTRSCPTLINE